VEELEPKRNLGQNPLFQVLFALYYAPAAIRELGPGLRVELGGVAGEQAKFDLTLSMTVEKEGLPTGLEYNTDLFDVTTIRRLAGHLETLLAGAVADPERGLSELPLVPAAERHQLLCEWNDSRTADPGDLLLHALFARQAAATPEAVAVAGGDEQLSYRELEARANRLAQELEARGVGPEVRVGISMERSPAMVVGLLAILKAGGAYLPLDPTHPEQRLASMLADSRAPVLLSEEALAGRLRAASLAAELLCLDRDAAAIRRRRAQPPTSGVASASPAYVLYTSGSTGRPKGVVIPHRAIGNHMLWMQEALPLEASDRVLQKTPLSFDASVWEFWAPLLAGARLVLARPGEHRDPAALAETLRTREVTILQVVPSLLQPLIEQPRFAECRSLKRVFCGGEALTRELTERFFATGLRAALFNLYGPTEATIDATIASCGRRGTQAAVPIGRPVANLRIYLLDEHRRSVSLGAVGWLHIAGTGLARGYLERPQLTAETFVPDAFSEVPGRRLYDTGDLARHLPDGRIEFLGRADHQVKVRGFRIELGEIESVLAGYPGVREAVVVAPESGRVPGARELVAYLTGEPAAVRDLRAFLQETLPPYMVPAAFSFLDQLPRLPSGKVDRSALGRAPVPEALTEQLAATEGWVPPRDPTEELLVGIWEEVLAGGARVGVHDDFFELGGHSLLATQVISRIRDLFAVELPLLALFETPTPAGMAASSWIAGRVEAGPASSPIAPRSEGEEAAPLSFAQQRLWFLAQLEPGVAAYNIPLALRLRGPFFRAALAATLSEIVRRHQALRTRFVDRPQGEPYQVVCEPAPFPLPVVDLAALRAEDREREAQRLAMEDAARPFDLARDPLVRGALLHANRREHFFLLNMHHIVSDGWSMGVFDRELRMLYEAFASGTPPFDGPRSDNGPKPAPSQRLRPTAASEKTSPLPELTIQYADFASWQRQWLQGEVLEAQLAYWREQLAGMEELELPTDRPRPAIPTYRGALRPMVLPPALTGSLKTLSRRQGSTLFMTLLAGFQLLLHHHTRQHDLAVGSPVANRNRSEIEGLIGFFV
ncbi:MAG: amino acid adenylation domain-containing protein, partial [bacterium]|nr:amino acid adenylation domain-containing protein [bacterium]